MTSQLNQPPPAVDSSPTARSQDPPLSYYYNHRKLTAELTRLIRQAVQDSSRRNIFFSVSSFFRSLSRLGSPAGQSQLLMLPLPLFSLLTVFLLVSSSSSSCYKKRQCHHRCYRGRSSGSGDSIEAAFATGFVSAWRPQNQAPSSSHHPRQRRLPARTSSPPQAFLVTPSGERLRRRSSQRRATAPLLMLSKSPTVKITTRESIMSLLRSASNNNPITNSIDRPGRNTTSVTAATATAESAKTTKSRWLERAEQLYEFYVRHGHAMVPKRYPDNPQLGTWVNKQRQLYRHLRRTRQHVKGGVAPQLSSSISPSNSLTDERIEILNRMKFCWDGRAKTERKNSNSDGSRHEESSGESESSEECSNNNDDDDDQDWTLHYNDLRRSQYADRVADIPANSRLGKWIRRQRTTLLPKNGGSSGGETGDDQAAAPAAGACADLDSLRQRRFQALQELDPNWYLSSRELTWEERYRELLEYRRQHGDCCVPISFPTNKKLGQWVSNQRKQNNLREKGMPSNMTNERRAKLEAIGFVWSHWDRYYSACLDRADVGQRACNAGGLRVS